MMASISKLLRLFSSLLLSVLIVGCNTSATSVLKTPNNLNYSEANKIIPAMPIYFDIESIPTAFSAYKSDDYSRLYNELDIYKSTIFSDFTKIGTADLKKNIFDSRTPSKYNGYIRARLDNVKLSNHIAMLFPSILLLGVPSLLGAPFCHTGMDCNYVFDLCDCTGKVIKSYTIHTYTRTYIGLYQMFGDTSFRSPMAVSYKKALKTLDKQLMSDKNEITASIRESNKRLENARIKAAKIMDEKGINSFEDDLQYADESPKRLLNKLNEIIANDRNNVYARMYRSFMKSATNDYTGALADISAYADVNPTCILSHPYAYKSTLLGILNRNLESLIEADKAVFYNKNDANSWIALGRAYNRMGLYDEGIEALKKSVKLDPNLADIYHEIRQCENESQSFRNNKQMYEQYRAQQVANAMSQFSNAVSNSITTVGTLVAPQQNSANLSNRPLDSSSKDSSSSMLKRTECTNCHGKGTVAGTSTVSFSSSSTYYCDECGREVPSSHSHDRCPSCLGKGYVTRIRR